MGDMKEDHLVLLGRIDGKLEGVLDEQGQQAKLLQDIDARLRSQEQRSVALGGVSGGVVSVGMAILIESLKGWIGRGGNS